MKKMGLMLVVLVFSLNACATVDTSPKAGFKTDAPLPPEPITIVKPGPEIAPELAAFSGAWFGRWDGQMDHILIVEQIESPEKITALYSFGRGFGAEPGWIWIRGRFVRGELRFQLRPGTDATYWLRGETLKAIYRRDGVRSEADLRKFDLKIY